MFENISIVDLSLSRYRANVCFTLNFHFIMQLSRVSLRASRFFIIFIYGRFDLNEISSGTCQNGYLAVAKINIIKICL